MTVQNTSHAVMAQRFEADDAPDDFPTPPWATRALCELLRDSGIPTKRLWVWEPACGRGHMARALEDYFKGVTFTDAYHYPDSNLGDPRDYLTARTFGRHDAIITNPPFRLALQFAIKALDEAPVVALLCRSAWAEGVGRYERLFSIRKPAIVAQFVERVPMARGKCLRGASTATSYSWFVWLGLASSTRFEWIEPCRKDLERLGDYDDDKKESA